MWWGRSHCTSCNKFLQVIDLIPIFSYMINRGKCRQCQSKVSSIYPLLEIVMGLVFASIGYYLIYIPEVFMGETQEITKLIFLLFLWFVLVVFTFYDILFLEIPEQVLAVWIWWVFLVLTLQTLFPYFSLLDNYGVTHTYLVEGIFAVVLTGAIILGMYAIMLKELDTKYDILILGLAGLLLMGYKELFGMFLEVPLISGLVAVYFLFLFFYAQIFISGGKWLGGGDLRIAILMGLILWANLIFFGVLLTYIFGSIIGIWIILYKKIIISHKWRVDTMIPFWPFLALWTLFTLFFQDQILFFFTNI